MREDVVSIVRRSAFRFAMTGIVGIWLSGCADATRFADSSSPFSNPFASDASAPTPRVGATPLVSERPLKGSYAAAARPSPRVASATSMPDPEATGSIRPSRIEPVGGSARGWTAVGGAPVIVGASDDSATLSHRYGVPEAALLSANGLSSRSDVHANMRIVIPVYNANGDTRVAKADDGERDAAKARRLAKSDEEDRDAAKARRAAKRAEAEADDGDDDKKPERGDSSHKKHKAEAKADSDEADAKKLAKAEKLKKAEKSEKLAKSDSEEKSAKALKAEKLAEAKAAKSASEVAKQDPPRAARRPETDRTPTASVAPAAETASASEGGEFRWPARGRIIQGFKSGGNDGINIALPEGTSVRAAEDGKVAYAGNALKGYGNLVLIRHSNGFVSAYANNGELDVKQGETVKRGQVIAKSGATGDVSTPQLHFELRRGQTPVDPISHLAGL